MEQIHFEIELNFFFIWQTGGNVSQIFFSFFQTELEHLSGKGRKEAKEKKLKSKTEGTEKLQFF